MTDMEKVSELVEAVRHLVALIDDREACRTGSNGDQILQAESRLRAALASRSIHKGEE